MPNSGSRISALRELLQARFPQSSRAAAEVCPTGIEQVDAAAGGVPQAALTEVVCRSPSCGSQLLLGQMLCQVRARGGRMALIDADDRFDPSFWPPPALASLVWVRCSAPEQAVPAADVLARDANFACVAMDLRDTALPVLRRVPPTAWYRLQRAVEQSAAALIVLTSFPLIPSARLRLDLTQSHSLTAQAEERSALCTSLPVLLQRQRLAAAG
ncbi:MAG TPA: hypothetical protein VGL42_11900 [Opitutaceae bacterium]|jgi:hypothetical protein